MKLTQKELKLSTDVKILVKDFFYFKADILNSRRHATIEGKNNSYKKERKRDMNY